jgi:hypothetical protein
MPIGVMGTARFLGTRCRADGPGVSPGSLRIDGGADIA